MNMEFVTIMIENPDGEFGEPAVSVEAREAKTDKLLAKRWIHFDRWVKVESILIEAIEKTGLKFEILKPSA